MRANVKKVLKKAKTDWVKLAKQNKIPKEIIARVKAKADKQIQGED